jgi:uncharacterized membrane protein HdeD (DUF308 family)
MSVDSSPRTAFTALRTGLGIAGAVSVIVGLLILFWPERTAAVAVAIFAVWAIIAGLVYAALGIFSRTLKSWSRAGHVALGVLFVIAGVIALTNLPAATLWLAVFVGLAVGVLWVVEGVMALSTLGAAGSRGWSIFFGVVSILAGIVLLFSPLFVALLWLFLGASLLVLGVLQIVRAITLGRGTV